MTDNEKKLNTFISIQDERTKRFNDWHSQLKHFKQDSARLEHVIKDLTKIVALEKGLGKLK